MASPEAIALRLGTSVKTIEDLEHGRITALPHWAETVRIVRAYLGLRQIDPGPMLAHIQKLLQSTPSAEEAAMDRAAQVGPSPKILRGAHSRAPVRVEPLPDIDHEGGGGLRRLLVMGAAPALLALTAYLTVIAPGVGYRVIRLLPASLAVPAKNGLDTIVLYSAPTRENLKWIDIGDPRLRRGDKLPTKTR